MMTFVTPSMTPSLNKSMISDHSYLGIQANDLRILRESPLAQKRAVVAQKICRHIRERDMTSSEYDFAYKILNAIMDDVADIVRRALAVTLKTSPNLPRDIAKKLAADIDTIAVPVLKHSPVFTDQDLIEVLRSHMSEKAEAIATRPVVNSPVVGAIIRYGGPRAAVALAANDGAIIDPQNATLMMALYKEEDIIEQGFLARRNVSAPILDKLMGLVTQESAKRLYERHRLSLEMTLEIMERVKERARIDLFDRDWPQNDIERLMDYLEQKGELTRSFLIRSACSGHVEFTTHILARFAGVSHAKAVLMFYDQGDFALQILCNRAQLSSRDFYIIKAASLIYRDLEQSGIDYNKDIFQSRMVERVLTLPLDLTPEIEAFLLEKLDRINFK